MNWIEGILNQIDSIMYYPVLIIVMAMAGIYFTVRTRGVQIRLFLESCRLIMESPEDSTQVVPILPMPQGNRHIITVQVTEQLRRLVF